MSKTMRVPPTYSPTLVGQGWDSLKLFAPGVRIMTKQDGKFTLGTRLDLPTGATVFNCVWLPAGKNGKGEQLVMLSLRAFVIARCCADAAKRQAD